MILKLLLSTHILNVFAFAFWGPLFSAFAIALGATPSLAGSLYALYTLVHALAIFVFGQIDRNTNRVALLGTGYAIQGLCATVFIVVESPTLLAIPLCISAVAGGMIAPAWKALYTNAVEQGKEGKQWSFYDSGTMIAVAGGSFLAGVLADFF